MNELSTDLKSLHEATLKHLKNSKASNTLRAYKSDFKDFGAFCAKHGLNSLPTEPKIISLYLTHLSKNTKTALFADLACLQIPEMSIFQKKKGPCGSAPNTEGLFRRYLHKIN